MRLPLLAVLAGLAASPPVWEAKAQEPRAEEPRHGGVLKVFHRDSPASPSILEESSDFVTAPFMRNFTQYCNRALQPLFDRQSMETDPAARRALVWEIDRRLQEDLARPILYHNKAVTCWQPWLHGITPMMNSVYNWPQFEDVWLER